MSGSHHESERHRQTAGTHDPGFLTVSNLLSLSRIPLGLSFLALSDPRWLAGVVVVSGLTDLLDGFIARVSRTVSQVGLLLDPFCDKLFVLMCLVSFIPGPHLNWADFLILILRDVFTGGSYLIGRISGTIVPFRPRWGGKFVTSLQLLTLLALIFWPRYVPLLILLVGITSVYSVIDYGMSALREQQRKHLVPGR
ncbi:MAG: CDP-alcohol phosphatidyltransferase family protein [Gemmatimonadota bacterium]